MTSLLISRDDLERRFDGPIPGQLLTDRTEAELMADHHRAMIRFFKVRVQDFRESLARLEERFANGETDAGMVAWIARTKGCITDHQREIEQHEADLMALDRRTPGHLLAAE